MNDLRGFVQTVDTPKEKEWEWNGYRIDWRPLPDDGSWDEDWAYLLVYTGLSTRRSSGLGFSTLQEAIDYAVGDDADCTRLDVFGGCVNYFDPVVGARVTRYGKGFTMPPTKRRWWKAAQ